LASELAQSLDQKDKAPISAIHPLPAGEPDLLAYRGTENEVLVVKCKSYLDSRGVLFSAFTDGAKLSER
jgi:hypothetical protein